MTSLREAWCSLFHGGGRIERDSEGRINWRCAKCGRWSNSPVPAEVERKHIDAAIRERLLP